MTGIGEENRGRERRPRPWLLVCLVALVGVLALPASSVGASKWTVRALPERVLLGGVSCPSESLCVAVGAMDTVAFSQAPTAGADRWHVVEPMYEEPRQSCLERGEPASFCIQPRGILMPLITPLAAEG